MERTTQSHRLRAYPPVPARKIYSLRNLLVSAMTIFYEQERTLSSSFSDLLILTGSVDPTYFCQLRASYPYAKWARPPRRLTPAAIKA